MCGGGNNAAAAAQAAEDQRQTQIAYTSAAINNAYDNPARAAQLQDFLGATREYYAQDLAKQNTQATNDARFALARQGVAGGSYAVDVSKRLADTYNDATLTAERKAQAAVAGLRAQDDTARQNLLALAQSGASVTNAQQQAANSFASSLATGQSQAVQNGLGDLFGGFADVTKNANDAAARRQAGRDYGTTYGTASNGGFSGGFH